MFEVPSSQSFDERECEILDFWRRGQIFEKSIEQRRDRPHFVTFDGPPFATGLPHYGHLLAGTIKDVVFRYKTMKGFCVPRRFGWDCHGLPIENEIEKKHSLSGKQSIEAFGIARFNEECRSVVLRYVKEWEGTVQRMGRWVSFEETWKTMDLTFMESVWWVFKSLYDKGLVYEGLKVMPLSAQLGTPLSNFEAGENYREIDDPSLTVSFEVEGEENTFLLAWTTTPWTLLSNLALMVHPDILYVKVREAKSQRLLILAKERLSSCFRNEEDYSLLEEFPGKNLIGKGYLPLFDYFSAEKENGAFRVIGEAGVSTDEGTGIVHTAPAFGEMDFIACQHAGIPLVCPVDVNGKFTRQIPEYEGQFVKDADKEIIRRLKGEGKVFQHGTLRHRYPFCWRSDTPLIYRAMETWFVSVEKIKDPLSAMNEQIHWTPHHLKYGRFGKWLEGARDWAISRNRYWGTPIPLWRAEDGEILVVGSIAELESLAKTKIDDLHRHFIDDLVIERKGKTFRRIPEVFDCWFESGSMPYGEKHYPFENREWVEEHLPADFIAEGLDQTRGWFYTLHILSTALFHRPAFRNVIVNGIILAEDGSKMSKRLKNYPDPEKVIRLYGADAIRLAMMHSGAVKGDDMRFKESEVELVLRQILLPLWNSYSFLLTYARIYQWRPAREEPFQPQAVLDRWILSQLEKLVTEVEEGMEDYDLSRAVEPLIAFIEQLTNWYIRRSRRRFWADEDTPDRREAFGTLYRVLIDFTKIAAPFIPFLSEAIYRNLRQTIDPESVHLCDFPSYHKEWRNPSLEQEMAAVQTVVSLGHALRKENKLRVRQPLSRAYVVSPNPEILSFLEKEKYLIGDELNVKEVILHQQEREFVRLQAKPNFRVLGKKVGKLMPHVQKKVAAMDQHHLHTLLNGGNVPLEVEGEMLILSPEDVGVERTVHEGLIAANQGDITIALETELTHELILEGISREIINKVNLLRKEQGFEVTDRIHLSLHAPGLIQEAVQEYQEYIQDEVLALTVDWKSSVRGQEYEIAGETARVEITKAS